MIDPLLAAQADRILGLTKKRAKRRRRRPQPQAAPQPVINVTVHVPHSDRPKRRGVRPGRPGDYIANDRSRSRRIAPSP